MFNRLFYSLFNAPSLHATHGLYCLLSVSTLSYCYSGHFLKSLCTKSLKLLSISMIWPAQKYHIVFSKTINFLDGQKYIEGILMVLTGRINQIIKMSWDRQLHRATKVILKQKWGIIACWIEISDLSSFILIFGHSASLFFIRIGQVHYVKLGILNTACSNFLNMFILNAFKRFFRNEWTKL